VFAVLAARPARADNSWEDYVPLYLQQQTEWCHAASLQMVAAWRAQYKGAQPAPNQCTIVGYELGSSTCGNQPAYTNQVVTGAQALGFSQAAFNNAVYNLADSMSQLQAVGPYIAQIMWSTGGGHYVVVKGTDVTTSTIEINDPIYGNMWVDYNKFLTSYENVGSWQYTVYNIQ
jgi:hypothetical protein